MTNSALLVGVNKYENGNNLRGCCNDVDDMRRILTSVLGYRYDDIVVLKDGEATKSNMLLCLHRMLKKMGKGELGFFHFSGHGSQVADNDGDEADFKDELICPHDMSWVAKRYITDDELSSVFASAPENSYIEVLLDSCHAGTATRCRGVRTIISPHNGIDLPVRRMVRSVEAVDKHVLWSGCRDNQYSAEALIDGEYHGAFTYYWTKILYEKPNILRHKLLKKVREELLKRNFDQIPQLTVSINVTK